MIFLLLIPLFIAQQTITAPMPVSDTNILSLLQQAQDCCDLKEWSAAFQNYQKILDLDSSNITARLGIKLANQQREHEAAQASHQEREKMINEVDHAWTLPTTNNDLSALSSPKEPSRIMHETAALTQKLRTIRIPKLELTDINLRDAIEQLHRKAYLLDESENDPNKKGINIVLSLEPQTEQAFREKKINLSLSDITLGEALHYMAQQAGLKIKNEPYAVLFISPKEANERLFTKEYTVPPDFIESEPFLKTTTSSEQEPVSLEPPSAKNFLLSQGITFPKGATATYLASSNTLLVKNSQTNLELIDDLLETSLATPTSQVEIETRFFEVKQNTLKERGFDWLWGACQLPFGSGVSHGGGTVPNQASYNANNYPFQQNGTPVGTIEGGPPGAGSVTSGNRTGSAAITANALDSLLLGSAGGPTAGVLALAGILTNPQFQVVLRAINQHKGIDLLSAPKITVSSGKKAAITVAREFPYPAEYSPPQIPQSQGSGVNPAIPSTPSSFKTRHVGVELQVTPILGPDNSTIELDLSPQIVEFQGFVNYGSPIFSQAPTFLAGQTNVVNGTSQILLTENNINQPVFSVRQVNTEVTLHDGQTVVLGGLMRDDVQKVEDKTPIVGDLPFIGHFFRSSSQQHIKRNLLIFVTVRLLPSSRESRVVKS